MKEMNFVNIHLYKRSSYKYSCKVNFLQRFVLVLKLSVLAVCKTSSSYFIGLTVFRIKTKTQKNQITVEWWWMVTYRPFFIILQFALGVETTSIFGREFWNTLYASCYTTWLKNNTAKPLFVVRTIPNPWFLLNTLRW